MRLFAIYENNRLTLTDNVTDEYFFQGKVICVKDYVQDKGEYIAIKKNDKFAIFSMEEFLHLFGDKFHMFDEETYFSKVG